MLGISRRNLADRLGVHVRSVRAWDYTTTASDAAWEILDAQAAWVLGTLAAVEDGLEASDEAHLTAYTNDDSALQAGLNMPASWHAAAVGLITLILSKDGRDVTVSYAPLPTNQTETP